MTRCHRFARILALVSLVIGLIVGRVDAEPELLDRIVAVVDDQVVLWSELNLRTQLDLQAQGRNPMFLGEPELIGERSRVLGEMVDELVVVKKAEKDSLEVDAELLQALAKRFILTGRVGELKASMDLEPFDGVREAEKLERLRTMAAELGLSASLIDDLFSRIMREAVLNHKQLKEARG